MAKTIEMSTAHPSLADIRATLSTIPEMTEEEAGRATDRAMAAIKREVRRNTWSKRWSR